MAKMLPDKLPADRLSADKVAASKVLADDTPSSAVALAALPFETALAELEDIVRQLEGGRVALEDSIAIYERGEALKAHCEGLLKRAEARIERIALGPTGEPIGTVPLDPAG